MNLKSQINSNRLEQSAIILLFLLLSADLVLIILHCLYYLTDWISFEYFIVSRDRGYGELFQYIKEFWIILLFGLIFLKRRNWIYIIFALLFSYFLIDDSFSMHEGIGELISLRYHMQPAFGLRPVDFGELIVSFFYGALFLPLFIYGYHKSDISDRQVIMRVFFLILALVLFGVVIDMIHVRYNSAPSAWVWALAEDGGEMIVMSFLLGYVFAVYGLKGESDLE